MSRANRHDPVVIKRYGGTRLYDPAAGRYVTRDELHDRARTGMRIAVVDAETGLDLTADLLSRGRE